jgi:predicted DNA-binding protein
MERQIYKEQSKQIRVSAELHKKLKVVSAGRGITVKSMVEEMIEEVLKES